MKLRSTLLAAALTTTAAISQASIVTNGGFESGLTGWTCVVSASPSGNCGTSNFASPPEGAAHFFGFENAVPPGVLSQSLATESGATYSISFLFNSSTDEPTNTLAVDVGDLNAVLDVVVDTWTSFSGLFTASGASTDLEFLFRTIGGSGTLQIDNVVVDRVSAVPTPATLALALLGLGLTGAVRRVRR